MVSCYDCSIIGICLSTWGIIQLTIMGYCYSIEAATLIEDVEPEPEINYKDFISECEKNYRAAGGNCYACAYLYIILMIISLFFFLNRRLVNVEKNQEVENDEYFCNKRPKKKFWQRKKNIE